jgi:hypothetical protein
MRPRANDLLGRPRVSWGERSTQPSQSSEGQSWPGKGTHAGCKPKGLCFNQGERSLTELIFHIVYVYDRATLDSATL